MFDKIVDFFEELGEIIWNWTVEPFKDLGTLKSLVFGSSNEDLVYLTFESHEITNIYAPGSSAMTLLAGFFVLIGIVIAGMRMSSTAINPSNRTAFYESLKDIFIVGIGIANIGNLYALLFHVNVAIVKFFEAGTVSGLDTQYSAFKNGGVLGVLIINLVLLGLMIWANFYYMMRKLTLLILMIIGPVMLALWLTPKTKGITVAWMKELVGTVFVQSIHALTFWIVAGISTEETNIISTVILYVVFIPVAETLKNLIGLSTQAQGTLNKAGAAFGLSALAGVAGAVKGAVKDQSMMGALKSAYQGTKSSKGKDGESGENEGKSTLGGNAGTVEGTNAKAERMLKAGQITSKAGKAVFGAAGSIAGSGLGPAGSIALGAAGFGLGGAVGGLAGRTGAAGVMGIGKRFGKGAEGFKDELNKFDSSKGMDALAENMADKETTAWAKDNKDEMMKDLKERFPDASDHSREQMFNKSLKDRHKSNKANALKSLQGIQDQDGKYAKASDLASESAEKLTSAWANENRADAFKQMKKENPNITENEQLEKWNDMVGKKKKQVLQTANDTASKMSNGVPLEKASINKGDFAKALNESFMSNEKTQFKNSMKGKGLTDNEVEVMFNEKQGGKETVYAEALKTAGNGVKGQTLMNKGHINGDHFASMMATNLTTNAKAGQIDKLKGQGYSDQQAESQWNNAVKPSLYQDNFKNVKNNMAQFAPGKVVIPSGIGNAVAKGSIGALGFAKGVSGINEIKSVLGDTKIGAIAQSAATGFMANASMTMATPTSIGGSSVQNVGAGISKGINALSSGVRGAVSYGKNTSNEEFFPQNTRENHQGFNNGVSYAGGVVFGVNGYQKGAQFANTINPYNKALNNQNAEVSEIAQIASREPGSVRLVTTNDQSYIQVKGKTGQQMVVSSYGSGDSSLNKGQTLYQDLDVQGGALVPQKIAGSQSSVYEMDSGGGKIVSNRSLNINPNKLVANRSKTAPAPVEMQPYNQQVDDGQYYFDEAVKAHRNIRVVTTREKSFVVGEDSSGNEHRISQYGQGDYRLNEGEQIFSDCKVSNKRLKVTRVYEVAQNNQQNEVDHYSSFDPNTLIPQKENSRLQRRKETESARFQGV